MWVIDELRILKKPVWCYSSRFVIECSNQIDRFQPLTNRFSALEDAIDAWKTIRKHGVRAQDWAMRFRNLETHEVIPEEAL